MKSYKTITKEEQVPAGFTCDKCQILMPTPGKWQFERPERSFSVNGFEAGNLTPEDFLRGIYYTLDLCPTCFEEIREFVKQGLGFDIKKEHIL